MTDAVLLDFFGTLVNYSPSRTEQGYESAHADLMRAGIACSYGRYLEAWVTAAGELDAATSMSLQEYTMDEVSQAVLRELTGIEPDAALVSQQAQAYLANWQRGITDIDGVPEMLAQLARSAQLVLVSNTHDPAMVPAHLQRLGIAELFTAVVLSVDVGWRKPHPSVYDSALAAVGVGPGRATFVGDDLEADVHGPRRAGMAALLVSASEVAGVDEADRLQTILDLPARLDAG